MGQKGGTLAFGVNRDDVGVVWLFGPKVCVKHGRLAACDEYFSKEKESALWVIDETTSKVVTTRTKEADGRVSEVAVECDQKRIVTAVS